MFIINLIVAFVLTMLIMGIIGSIPKIPVHIRIAIWIAFVIVMFFFIKELTEASSFWDVINLNALENLYEMKKK